MANLYMAAQEPTLYFIGVTTEKSSIIRVFPKWAKALGIHAVIRGFDFAQHSDDALYRECVEFIKNDPLSMGALVTTHKIDLLNSCRDLFDELDPYALQLGEVSCISKRSGKLRGHAKDPISSGMALERFVPKNFWADHAGECLLLGAGGASLAISVYLAQEEFGRNIPDRITITNRSLPRLESARRILEGMRGRLKFAFVHNPEAGQNDQTLAALPPYSLIVNATGLGKDAPGSPLTDAAAFPRHSLVWEINYRGELLFMEQANAQRKACDLVVEDGWIYFIHGWTQVISEVFGVPIVGETLEQLSRIAKQA